MTLIRIVKDWDYPNLYQQTPNLAGAWDGLQFTLEPVDKCDYLIALNRLPENIAVTCPPEHVWVLIQEPPVAEYHWHRKGFHNFHRVHTQDTSLQGQQYVHTQPATPWHVHQTYDFLKNCPPPEKPKTLSTITSMAASRAGHRKRLDFLFGLRESVNFDWIATMDYVRRIFPESDVHQVQREKEAEGYTCVEGKWEGHAPYRYSLVFENHSGLYYWTEKLMDCFLAWTMPIYYGCSNIDDYFPSEAMLKIDINQPEEATEIIKEAVASDLWLKRRDAIAHARELCLDKHQLIPFLANLIREFESKNPDYPAQPLQLTGLPYLYGVAEKPKPSLLRRTISRAKRLVKKLLS
jgi:hypothetical protein